MIADVDEYYDAQTTIGLATRKQPDAGRQDELPGRSSPGQHYHQFGPVQLKSHFGNGLLRAKNAVRSIGRLRWWNGAVNFSFLLCPAACRTRSSACDTLPRSCARRVLC